MEQERFKARDVMPTALRLPPALRAELQKLAFANDRSLSKEIIKRLEASLAYSSPTVGADGAYTTAPLTTPPSINESGPSGVISDADKTMLNLFHKLPFEKQLALLSLLR